MGRLGALHSTRHAWCAKGACKSGFVRLEGALPLVWWVETQAAELPRQHPKLPPMIILRGESTPASFGSL
jgi:hypothetical protein